MTIQKAVKEAKSFHQSAMLAKSLGGLSATTAMCFERRDYWMSIARRM